MATAKDTLNPLSEISLLFGRDGLAHKDLESLTEAITDLISTLEKRTGKPKEKDKEDAVVGNLFKDIKDFSRGVFDTAVKNPFKYSKNTVVSGINGIVSGAKAVGAAKDFISNKVTGKSTMSDNLSKVETPEEAIPQINEQPKIEPTFETEAPPKIEPTISEKDKVQPVVLEPMLSDKDKVEPVFDTKAYDTASIKPTLDMVEPTKEKEDKSNIQSDSDNKILSNMVEVLIDLRDDKSQKQILNEAIAIRKIISDQAKATALPAGIEPNSEESKQEDREKLAEAIARRLEDVMGNLGGGGIPMLSRPAPAGIPSAAATGAGSALLAGSVIGGVAASGAALSYGATNVLQSMSKEQRTQLTGDVGSDTSMAAAILNQGDQLPEERAKEESDNKLLEKAPWYTRMYGIGKTDFLKNANSGQDTAKETIKPKTFDPKAAGISADEAKAALENGSERDIEKLGGKEALENIVNGKETNNTRSIQKITSNYNTEEANSARANFASSDPRRVDVQPKENQVTVKDILNQVNEENTQLKMFSDTSQATQMIAPIVSNKTINNTEQTIVGSSPSPHPSTNSFMRWQNRRGAYTD
jgi:hypothetical protein